MRGMRWLGFCVLAGCMGTHGAMLGSHDGGAETELPSDPEPAPDAGERSDREEDEADAGDVVPIAARDAAQAEEDAGRVRGEEEDASRPGEGGEDAAGGDGADASAEGVTEAPSGSDAGAPGGARSLLCTFEPWHCR